MATRALTLIGLALVVAGVLTRNLGISTLATIPLGLACYLWWMQDRARQP